MTRRIDFYLLAESSWQASLPFANQLAAKVYKQGHSLIITSQNLEDLQQLSNLLWTCPADSFIPHDWDTNGIKPVLRVSSKPLTATSAIVLSLGLPEPQDNQPWERWLQIVPNEKNLLTTARVHYRHYQQQGYTLNTHQLNKTKNSG